MFIHVVTPHGPSVIVEQTPAQPSPLTASGPVTISSNGQIVEDLDITAGTGTNAVTVNNGVINWTIRRCRIRHNLGGKGIFAAFNCTGGTIQDVDIENVHHETLSAYAGYATPDANINIHIAESGNLTITRARLRGGASGIYLQGNSTTHTSTASISFIEGYNVKGVFPRGQLLQASFWDDVTFTDFSLINDPLNDRGEDLFNFFDCTRPIVRRGLTKGGGSPSGSGGLFESGCVDGIMEDVDSVDVHNVGLGSHAAASAQSHGTLVKNCRVRDLRSLDCRWFDGTTCYPRSANVTPFNPSGLPTTSALFWSAQSGTTRYETCNHFYDPAQNGGLPLNLLFPSGNASYVTDQATDLAFEDFVPRAPISLTMPWE